MKWRKTCTGLKFDLEHFNGPQTKFIGDSLYKHPVYYLDPVRHGPVPREVQSEEVQAARPLPDQGGIPPDDDQPAGVRQRGGGECPHG